MPPSKNTSTNNDTITKLIDFLGINPSTVIKFLIGLIISTGFSGYGLCYFILSNKHEMTILKLETKHQRELADAESKGKKEAYFEYQKQVDYMKTINSIVTKEK